MLLSTQVTADSSQHFIQIVFLLLQPLPPSCSLHSQKTSYEGSFLNLIKAIRYHLHQSKHKPTSIEHTFFSFLPDTMRVSLFLPLPVISFRLLLLEACYSPTLPLSTLTSPSQWVFSITILNTHLFLYIFLKTQNNYSLWSIAPMLPGATKTFEKAI